MPVATPLENLNKETKAEFVIAKSDGVLDASEVVKIAVGLAQKIQQLGALSGAEKKSLLLHALKQGLDTSGGIGNLPGFESATEDVKKALEEQLINSASAAIDAVLLAFSGKLDLRKPSSWKACLPACISAARVLLPKDQQVLGKALEYAATLSKEDTVETVHVDIVKEVTNNTVTDGEAPPVPGTATSQ